MSHSNEAVVFPKEFGFCGGVASADQLMFRVSEEAHAVGIDTVYGLHHIVHNKEVSRFHEARGVRFVEEPDEIPPNQLVVTSAHGIGPETQYALEQNGATTFDAACPLVIATHKAAQRARRQGEKILYVCHGKPGEVAKIHDEVQGMLSHLDYTYTTDGPKFAPVERHFLELDEEPSDALLSVSGLYRIVSQTTLLATPAIAYRDFVKNFIQKQQPQARVGHAEVREVCRAVEDRQAGVEQLVKLKPRRLVVVTDPSSSNGKSYVELARTLTEHDDTISVHAVANAAEAALLEPVDGITGLTASASTPDSTTLEVARILGLANPPEIKREPFHIPDLKGYRVQEKVRMHVSRSSAA